MAVSRTLLPAISLLLILLSQSTAQISQTSHSDREDHRLIGEVQEAQLKIARLESILDECVLNLNSKSLRLTKGEKLIEEMTREVDRLQSVLLSVKDDSSQTNERINGLEAEVRHLWAASRKNNFQMHALESKLEDAYKRLGRVTRRVDMMDGIVGEQWIQIRELEQALLNAEVRMMKIKRQVSSTRCSFFKFIRKRFGNLLESSRAMLERTLLAAKHYHRQLQVFIKHEMEKSKYTAALANAEVVFFVASALITFPALSVGIFLLNNFN